MNYQPVTGELTPLTWLDAFPWLRAVLAGSRDATWWSLAVDDASLVERRQRFAEIAELIMNRLTGWTIGQVFPWLPLGLDVAGLGLPTRPRNILAREGLRRLNDVAGLTVDDLLALRNMGLGSLDNILQALAEVSTSSPELSDTPQAPVSHGARTTPASAPSPAWMHVLADDLSRIAMWKTAIGLPAEPLLTGSSPTGTPDEVVKARQRLGELTANDVLDDVALARDAATLLDAAFQELDPRAVEVLKQRLLADEPVTLDQLAQQFNVTRERIRQIEGRARAAILDALTTDALDMVATAARSTIGRIRPLDDLIRQLPVLASTVDSVGQPIWRVIDRLDDAYEIEDGWCVVPTLSAARDWTKTHLREHANQYGVVGLDDLDLIETAVPEKRTELTKQWVSACGYVVDGEHVLTRTRSVSDYAAAILSLEGVPMTSQAIVDRFVVSRSTGSLKNATSVDDRFDRVDRDRWALREWGLDAYTGVRSVIRDQLAKAGGKVTLDDLVGTITSKYSVSASSVITYANTPPFETRDDVVRLAGTSRNIRKTPEQTARLFRWPDAWGYRVKVTHDHLRGSGSVAPMAVATILDLQFGDRRQLESNLGPQLVAWSGTQPAFGTVRRFLLDADVEAGTEVFLVIHDGGRFSVKLADRLSGEALPDALSMIGAPRELEVTQARATLAFAVRMRPGASVISVIGKYRERGDTDVADLLANVKQYLETGQQAPSAVRANGVDEILDLL